MQSKYAATTGARGTPQQERTPYRRITDLLSTQRNLSNVLCASYTMLNKTRILGINKYETAIALQNSIHLNKHN